MRVTIVKVPEAKSEKKPEMKAGGKWLKKAVNPKHKGYCTPMTKKTCTPHRKALAKRFKHGDLHKKQGGGDQQQGQQQQQQIMQIIQAYAEMSGQNPQEIMQQLQQMNPAQQSHALKQMAQAIQQGQQQQSGQQQQQQQPQKAQTGVYKTQAEVDAANTQAKAFAKKMGLMIGEDAYVAKKPGDPKIPFVDIYGRPSVGNNIPKNNINLTTQIPPEVGGNDLFFDSEKNLTYYNDPQSGDIKYAPADYRYLPRFQRNKTIEDQNGVISKYYYGGKKRMKYQVGGNGSVQNVPSKFANVEAEEGEVVQGRDGNIVKVDDNAGTHEQGGVKLNNVSRVLEDTSDKRKDKASKLLKITPEEMQSLFGFKPKSGVSHSKAFELANDHYDKKRKKVKDANKVINSKPEIDKIGSTTAQLNFKTIKDIPSKEDVYDALFMHQEAVKGIHDIQDDGSIGKAGWKPKYRIGGKAQAGIDNAQRLHDTTGWEFLYSKSGKNYYKKQDGTISEGPKMTNQQWIDYLKNEKPANKQARLARQKGNTSYGYTGNVADPMDVNPTPIRDMNPFVNTTENTTNNISGPSTDKTNLDTSVNINPKFIKQPDNSFHEPTYWDELAPGLTELADSERRLPELYNPIKLSQLKYKLLNPTPAMNANQADYNAALKTLGNMPGGSGAAASNLANLQAQKYAANDQIEGNYENQNTAIKNQEIGYNTNVRDRQAMADAQARGTYYDRTLQSRENQRQQRAKAIEDISRVIQMKRRQNASGNLIMKLSPAFNQRGEYNGYQQAMVLPNELGMENVIPTVGNKKGMSKNKKEVTKTWKDPSGEVHKETSYVYE